MQKLIPILMICLTTTTGQVFAYGSSSSSSKSCAKPTFSQFTPADKSEIGSGSEFSFTAVGVIDPKTIEVTVKNQPVELAIDSKGKVHKVSGKLPDNLNDTFARIAIRADGHNRCTGFGGWLVKISE